MAAAVAVTVQAEGKTGETGKDTEMTGISRRLHEEEKAVLAAVTVMGKEREVPMETVMVTVTTEMEQGTSSTE